MNDTCTYVCRLVFLILSCHSPHFTGHVQAGWLAKGDARGYVSCSMGLLGDTTAMASDLNDRRDAQRNPSCGICDMLLSIHNCFF